MTCDCLIHMKYLCILCYLENSSFLCYGAVPSTKDVLSNTVMKGLGSRRVEYSIQYPCHLVSDSPSVNMRPNFRSHVQQLLDICPSPQVVLLQEIKQPELFYNLNIPRRRQNLLHLLLIKQILLYKMITRISINQNRFAHSKSSLADIYTFRQGTTPKI